MTVHLGGFLLYERHRRLVLRLFGWRRTWWLGTQPPWEEW